MLSDIFLDEGDDSDKFCKAIFEYLVITLNNYIIIGLTAFVYIFLILF